MPGSTSSKPTQAPGPGSKLPDESSVESSRKERLAGMGIRAMGLVHDLNNILGSVTGHADLALVNPQDHEEAVKALQLVLWESERAAAMLQRFMQVVREGENRRSRTDLPDVVGLLLWDLGRRFDERDLVVTRQFEAESGVGCPPWAVYRLLAAVLETLVATTRPGTEVVLTTSSPDARTTKLDVCFTPADEAPEMKRPCWLRAQALARTINVTLHERRTAESTHVVLGFPAPVSEAQ